MTWAALIIWPIIAAVLFRTVRLPVAFLATIIGGYLLLPTQTAFDPPFLPALDKYGIPALAALAGVLLFAARSQFDANGRHLSPWPVLPGLLPRNPTALVLLAILFAGVVGTHLTNRDPLIYGPLWLPPLRPYDAMSAMLTTLMTLLPFFLARKVLASREGQILILKCLVIAATAYAFLALYEVRMSPQMNRMVYGFFPHDWSQHYRSGGWRPLVFLEHGLTLGIFFTTAVMAAACLVRLAEKKERLVWLLLMFWLLGTLFLSKVLGAQMICVTMLAAIFLLPRHLQILFAVFVVGCFLIYPVLRATNLLPFDLILSNVDPWRAASLQTRLDNEQLLLAKANERPLFGWGGWGRSRVYTEWGQDIAITDGGWVIRLGLSGWTGYIAFFGLMTWGVLSLLWRRHIADQVSVFLALILAAMIIDLAPNANQSPIIWLVAGSLIGRLEAARYRHEAPREATVETGAPKRDIRYTRGKAEVVSRTPEPQPERPVLPYRREFGKAKP